MAFVAKEYGLLFALFLVYFRANQMRLDRLFITYFQACGCIKECCCAKFENYSVSR